MKDKKNMLITLIINCYTHQSDQMQNKNTFPLYYTFKVNVEYNENGEKRITGLKMIRKR